MRNHLAIRYAALMACSLLVSAVSRSSTSPAATDSTEAELLSLFGNNKALLQGGASLPDGSRVGDDALARFKGHGDWRIALAAHALAAWRSDPNAVRELLALAPRRTAGGGLRFVGGLLAHPSTAAAMALRLLYGDESTATRGALAQLLAGQGATEGRLLVGLATVERESTVRAQLITGFKRIPMTIAAAPLREAVRDRDAGIRLAAIFAITYHPDGIQMRGDVARALRDPDAHVRALAARCAGWMHLDETVPSLRELLRDGESEVRLQSLSALRRIDQSSVKNLDDAKALVDDPDPNVAAAARRLLQP
jgi:hypothetical protein